MGPLTVPLIGIGASLLGNAINAGSQTAINKADREFQERMYGIQRKDALADWEMQNAYNSPGQQMARLSAAGLNPNLIYGNGATQPSSSVRPSSAGNYSPKAPQVDLSGVGQSLMSMYDIRLKQAQTDNVKQATEVAKQDAILKATQTVATAATAGKTGIDTRMGEFDLNLKKQLEPVTLEGSRVAVEKQKADLKYTLDNNERQALSNSQSLAKGIEEILNLRAARAQTYAQKQQIEQATRNAITDGSIKKIELQMKELGIQPGDNIIARILAAIIGGDVKGFINRLGMSMMK